MTEAGCQLGNDPRDDGMHVKMLMPVDVIHHEAGAAELFELRGDFGFGLTPQFRRKEQLGPKSDGVRREPAICPDEARHFVARQNWPAIDKRQV
jgi:hypothetical protein